MAELPGTSVDVEPDGFKFVHILQKSFNMENGNNVKHECPVPEGILVIIGGKESKDDKPEGHVQEENGSPLEVLKSVVNLCKEDPVIEIITTASSVGDESFKEYTEVFQKLGVKRTHHIHHNTHSEVLADDLSERIQEADLFFFTGGDQLKLSSIYGGTDFLLQLKNRYIYDPIVIAGTSAGAMAMSTPMIYAGNDEEQEISGEIKVTTGLEFLKDVCIDTHFVHRSRFVRMAQVIITNPTCIGIGIEEDTAIIVKNGVDASVIGSGVIIVIDGRYANHIDIDAFSNKNGVSVRDLKVHLLAKNNTYTIPQANPPHK